MIELTVQKVVFSCVHSYIQLGDARDSQMVRYYMEPRITKTPG